ncbi:uncharacterized protein LOC133850566 [Drosophila sulfurigaster albostrigata]|uniref:uncharacterized protein LOC133850566 n=1 Tax=Drosophila sulfurigaster albostrigata TaxID=89887 RepID=UPI002D21C317|nr:uncharacterized protein LOC133850566 [Drosophila sulfurigaster albostrigata]
MCNCQSLVWLDQLCCSLRTKIKIFCAWTILHSIIFFGGFGYSAFTECKYDEPCKANLYKGFCFLLSVIHVAAGIIMLLSFLSNLKNQFLFSVALSTLFPLGALHNYPLVYLIICQVVFIVFAVRYSATMKRNQNAVDPA